VTPLTLGIETMGGVRTPLIDKNTTIPTKASQVFSTAEDNQNAVTIHVLQGEREMAAGNKSLGRFDLTDIPPAARGVPQIEVTFDIDGLSEEEIEAMVADAEAHAEEDAKAKALVDARNQAETMINGVTKTMEEAGDSLDASDKTSIESAIAELEEAAKGDDAEEISAKVETLMQASHKLAEQMYGQAEGAEGAADMAGGAEAQDDNVVDAEFEEVKDDENKA